MTNIWNMSRASGKAGAHLLDIISDILDMSKIEAGKYELSLEEISIADTINTAVKMVQSRANEAGVKLSAGKLDKIKRTMIADRRGILQILLNLLSNAIKFTEEGGKITVACQEKEDFITIKVADTGIGIPPNKLASITRPFEQVSSSYTRDHEGSGLGLAITKELVELHGGSLLIDSTVGVGTTATVRLPYDCSKKIQKSA